MMAKPAATRDRPRNKLKGRPPRPDTPLLHRLPQPPPPPPPPSIRRRRSLRPRRRRQLSEVDDHDLDHEEEEEEEEGGLKKKLRLVVKLPRSPAGREYLLASRPRGPPAADPSSSSSSSPSPSSSSSSSYVDEEEPEDDAVEEEVNVKPSRKRQIDSSPHVAAARSRQREEWKKSLVGRSLGDVSGNLPATRDGTPMPERKELESVLDKLQKKDTYGAFAEPVDPAELPDYHDVIEHPMDFGTVRKKLARGAYGFFEQFEDDIFLICSNAMQYNAPDTIYFRQACTIQDMARKKFQNIRDSVKSIETDQRFEEDTRLNSMETPLTQCKSAVEPPSSDIYSGATLASAGDACARLSTENGIEKSVAVNGLVDVSSSIGESKGESKQEKVDDFSVKCSPSKLGRKATLIDENRRATYNVAPDKKPMVDSDLVLNVFEDEHRQLAPVALDAEHSYARSLARFAASLGPVAWGIVSERIEKALPPGMKFGPGWVGEYEPLPTSFLSLENHHQQHTSSSTSQSTKAKIPEMKSKAGQHPISTNMNFGLKNQVTTAAPRKAPNSGEFMSSENPGEQKPRVFGVTSTRHPKISGADLPMQSFDSNYKKSGYNNQMNKESSCVASVRVKEESPSEETTEVRQSVIQANHRPQQTTGTALNQQKKLATFNNAYTNISQQASLEKTTERKQMIVEANVKTQRAIGMASNQQKNQAIFKFTNAYPNISQQASVEEAIERKQTMIQVNEITQRTTCMASNQQKSPATFSFNNAYSNIPQQGPMGKPSSTHYSFPGIISKDSSHVQTETCKEFGAVPSRSGNNVNGIGGFIKGTRTDNPLKFVSSNQTGVNSSIGHCNTNDQASSDPFKLVDYAGKVSNQQYISCSSSISPSGQSASTVSPLSRENHSQAASAAARAWMSVGSSAQWKAVDGKNTEKPIASSPICSPTWKPLPSASRINGDSIERPPTFPLQVFGEASPIRNRGLVIFPQLISTDFPKFQSHPPWHGLSPQPQSKQRDNLPPDLNIGYQPPPSPVQPSSVALDSQQPDLALQL